jgi:hypothetical protein
MDPIWQITFSAGSVILLLGGTIIKVYDLQSKALGKRFSETMEAINNQKRELKDIINKQEEHLHEHLNRIYSHLNKINGRVGKMETGLDDHKDHDKDIHDRERREIERRFIEQMKDLEELKKEVRKGPC